MLRVSVFSPRNILMATAVAACLALFPLASRAQDDDPPAQAGRLSLVNGTVSIQPAGTQDWGQASLNYPVGSGDRIFTDSDGRAEIQVGRTYVRIGPNSDVTFVDFNSSDITFGAAQGSLHIRTFGLWDGQSLYIQTPSGTSTVTGPANFRVDVYPDQQTAIFSNYSGDVYVSGANDFGMDTASGQALQLVGTNPVYPQWLQPAGYDDLDNWSERRDQQITHAASFRYVSAEAPGVEDLDGYGQWTPATDYGDMWFPSVPAGWAPYRNGHWINRDPWGWTWVEDEPWGYAPFHFGRWINYQGRWGWVPGPRAEHPVWSPALVVFAGGIQAGGGGVSVWFPLGPGEAYRPWYPCSPRYVDRVNISNIQETRVVHVQKTYVNIVNVTNVTNVTNITYVNRTTGVTAIRHEDFAAGRPVARAAVHIDPQQMAHVQVMARPEVTPTAQAKISAPPVRRVPAAVARPVLINAKGMAVAAQPKARPLPPPVKTAPPPPRLPNRTVVAPPPNVKMTPAARQAMQTAPTSHPGQPPAPAAQQPAANRPVQPPVPTHPAGTTPPASGERQGQLPPNQQKPAPIPAPGTRPPAQPQPQTPPVPPQPTHQPTQPIRSTEKPVPVPVPEHQPPPPPPPHSQPQTPPRPAEPTQPTHQPTQPVRSTERPVPAPAPEHQPPPPPHPAERPAPQPAPQPRPVEHAAPPPRPEPPPQVHTVPPPVHAAPPQARPNSEPAPRPPERQPPPPEKEKKPKEEPKPQP
jgi:hypothetical protein